MRLIWLFSFVLGGCFSFNTLEEISPSPSPEIEIDTWENLGDGLETETYRADSVIFQAVRIDPNLYEFRAHYQPDNPLRIEQWQAALPDAEVIINANFFTPENTVLGLLVSDGQVFGQSYQDRGGTFFVLDGLVGIRNNIRQAYQGEAYSQAVQAFPMLVDNGQAAYQNSNAIQPSRRSVIGIDNAGRVIVMATPGFGMSLYALSQYLPTSDLGLLSAFNLDGGGSTMLYIKANDYMIRSFDPVPVVLAAYPR